MAVLFRPLWCQFPHVRVDPKGSPGPEPVWKGVAACQVPRMPQRAVTRPSKIWGNGGVEIAPAYR